MTALVGREVKRTFSEFRGFLAGLSGQCTLKARRQDSGYFSQTMPRFGGRC